jgi:3-hydroxypropanoate dehydrogenase
MTSTTSETGASVGQPVLDAATQDLLFTAAQTANTFTDEQLRAINDLARWPPMTANTNPPRILFGRTPEGKGLLGGRAYLAR